MQILALTLAPARRTCCVRYDKQPENALKLVMPCDGAAGSHPERPHRAGQDLLVDRCHMGGGPCAGLRDHLKAQAAFATPDAARTFNDDLEK